MLKHLLAASAVTVALAGATQAATFVLDADTVATGSTLDTTPLVNSYGTISFSGFIENSGDVDMTAAGASGNNFDIQSSSAAPVVMNFSFDVSSISFLYGGNGGGIFVNALDAAGAVIDSFTQASTSNGQPAGPVTLFGPGIRALSWNDTQGGWSFAALDNINVTVSAVPLPAGAVLLGSGLALMGGAARRRKRA